MTVPISVRRSDIEKEMDRFHQELDKYLAIIRYLSKTHIFPQPSSATGTRAQELFRRVLIYTSVVNRFLGLRPRNSLSGSTRAGTQHDEEGLFETPGEEMLGDSQKTLAELAPSGQKVIIVSLVLLRSRSFCRFESPETLWQKQKAHSYEAW